MKLKYEGLLNMDDLYAAGGGGSQQPMTHQSQASSYFGISQLLPGESEAYGLLPRKYRKEFRKIVRETLSKASEHKYNDLIRLICEPNQAKLSKDYISSHGFTILTYDTSGNRAGIPEGYGGGIAAKEIRLPPNVYLVEAGIVDESIVVTIDDYFVNLFISPHKIKEHLFDTRSSKTYPTKPTFYFYDEGENAEEHFKNNFSKDEPNFQKSILHGDYTPIIQFAERVYEKMEKENMPIYINKLKIKLEMYESIVKNVYMYSPGDIVYERLLSAIGDNNKREEWACIKNNEGDTNFLHDKEKYPYSSDMLQRGNTAGATYEQIIRFAQTKTTEDKPIIIFVSSCAVPDTSVLRPEQERMLYEIEKYQSLKQLEFSAIRKTASGVDGVKREDPSLKYPFNWYWDGTTITKAGEDFDTTMHNKKSLVTSQPEKEILHVMGDSDIWKKYPDNVAGPKEGEYAKYVWFKEEGPGGAGAEAGGAGAEAGGAGAEAGGAGAEAGKPVVKLMNEKTIMIKTPEEIRRHVKATIKQDIYEGGKQEDIIDDKPIGTEEEPIIKFQTDDSLWSAFGLIMSGLYNKEFWDTEYYLNPQGNLEKISHRLKRAGFDRYEQFDAERLEQKELLSSYFETYARDIMETDKRIETYNEFKERVGASGAGGGGGGGGASAAGGGGGGGGASAAGGGEEVANEEEVLAARFSWYRAAAAAGERMRAAAEAEAGGGGGGGGVPAMEEEAVVPPPPLSFTPVGSNFSFVPSGTPGVSNIPPSPAKPLARKRDGKGEGTPEKKATLSHPSAAPPAPPASGSMSNRKSARRPTKKQRFKRTRRNNRKRKTRRSSNRK
jgi:hypothetical protein